MNRYMRVKIGSELSTPRTVPGGSPQGSILGNFLFCVTTNELGDAPPTTPENDTVSFGDNGISGSDVSSHTGSDLDPPSPIAPPLPRSPNLTLLSDGSDITNEDESFQFFRPGRQRFLDDTPELSARYSQSEIDNILGVPPNWTDVPLSVKVYIDDLNNLEKVRHHNAVSNIANSRHLAD